MSCVRLTIIAGPDRDIILFVLIGAGSLEEYQAISRGEKAMDDQYETDLPNMKDYDELSGASKKSPKKKVKHKLKSSPPSRRKSEGGELIEKKKKKKKPRPSLPAVRTAANPLGGDKGLE